jgi:tryptophanase
VDLVCAEGLDPASTAPFKGNLDIEKLERCIAEHGKEKIPFGMVTVTNNNGAETPAPLELVRLAFPQFLRHFTCHFEVVDE